MLKDVVVYAVRGNLEYILKELKTLTELEAVNLDPDVREKVELVCSAFLSELDVDMTQERLDAHLLTMHLLVQYLNSLPVEDGLINLLVTESALNILKAIKEL